MDPEKLRRERSIAQQRMNAVTAEIRSILETPERSDDPQQAARARTLDAEWERLDNRLGEIDADLALHERATTNYLAGNSTPGDANTSVDRIERQRRQGLGEVLRSIEGNTLVEDDQREAMVRSVEGLTATTPHLDLIAARSAEAYLTAFGKKLVHGDATVDEWTTEERAAWQNVRTLERAVSVGVDTDGGFAVPFVIDPSVVSNFVGTLNPLRELARTVTTVGDTWQGLSRTGISATFEPEFTEVAEQNPNFAQPSIAVHKAQMFVPFSIESGQDVPGLIEMLGEAFREARDELEAEKFAVGTGVGEPEGLLTGLLANAAIAQAPNTPGALTSADIRTMWASLPASRRRNATWLCDASTNISIQAMGNGQDADYSTDFTDAGVLRLLGRPVEEAENMVGAGIDLILGDIRRAFTVCDRVGLNVELVPHLMGPNGRPTGARGLYAFFRTGSKVLDATAARRLTV